MPRLSTLSRASWTQDPSLAADQSATAELERGSLVFLPQLGFPVDADERSAFSPEVLAASKNVSFDPAGGRLGGTSLGGVQAEVLQRLMSRFSDHAAGLVDILFPEYRGHVTTARASFRPAEIAGRSSSWRKDDTRLHVDSFPASPVRGRRILRVFTNVNPSGRPRVWRIGGEFDEVARRFAPSLRIPFRGTSALLRAVRITKARRSPYDALMLQLHDRMKADADFQSNTTQERIEFPPLSTWLAFTDQVSHAAMSGQFQLEQTFLLPVSAMLDEQQSPLRILERIKGRPLV